MARGFESKSVADQQEAAQARIGRRRPVERDDPARALRKRTLQLARADVIQKLAGAQVPAHRTMLERALAALDQELASFS